MRWAEDHAAAGALGLTTFDEDDRYAALDWLQTHHERFERALVPLIAPSATFLYDLTSSYCEVQSNELAAHSFNRDGKR